MDRAEYRFSRNKTAFILISIFMLLIYSNTFHCSWHFDDYHSLINNPHLHIENIAPKSIIQTFFAASDRGMYRADKIYRPVSCLTLAINWYFGKDNVFGYHIINISIHILTAFFLFLTCLNLFNSPNLKNKYKGSEYFIALLTAFLWAANPIQTQAVTYIVQRMASMAAMFYIAGIYFYIKARLQSCSSGRADLKTVCYYLWCSLCFMLSVGSKENGATMPIALFFIELIFFHQSDIFKRKKTVLIGCAIIVSVFIAGVFIFLRADPFSFLNGYKGRAFTLTERLMTEPRIIFHYLTQIFYPAANRLSLVHDVNFSTSLFSPWTTMPAIAALFVIIGIGLYLIKKSPLISFAIIFFFLNHIIESSIIPLELFFEHRNYLPSLFIFFPVSAGLKKALDYYKGKNFFVFSSIIIFIPVFLVCIGSGTYIRNMAWADEKSLAEDIMVKCPGTARSHQGLGLYYMKNGNLDTALLLFEKSLSLKDPNPSYSRALSYKNMGNIYFKKNEFKKAVQFYKKSLSLKSNDELVIYDMTVAYINAGVWDKALENIDLLLAKKSDNAACLNLKGHIFLWQNNPEKALVFFRKAIKNEPQYKAAMVNMGAAFSKTGNFARAEWFYKTANRMSANDIITYFCLIENRLRADDGIGAEKYIKEMFLRFSIRDIERHLDKILTNYTTTPVSHRLLAPAVRKKIQEKAKQFSKI